MKYVPCGDSSFKNTRYYCKDNSFCYDLTQHKQAVYKETYDSRDGTVCSDGYVSCPC